MNGEKLWNTLITAISSSEEEMQTKTGSWFRVSSHNGKLYVDNASDNKPSSKLNKQRSISKKDFIDVNYYYDRWVSGEKGIRKEVIKISQNTAYIFALINKFNNFQMVKIDNREGNHNLRYKKKDYWDWLDYSTICVKVNPAYSGLTLTKGGISLSKIIIFA